MRHARTFTLPSLALALLTVASAPAFATAQRTFVASNGNDANPCSITAPCRGFTAAVTQTTAGGEVIVQDSAGYGPVTITKPISIIAPQGVYAGISVSSGAGVVVNHGSGEVTLRNLNLTGLGGANGIDFQSGDSLNIEGVVITGFTNAGIRVELTGSARLVIKDTISRNNGVYGAHIGTASGGVNVSVQRSRFEGNQFAGLWVYDRVSAELSDSVFNANPYGLVSKAATFGQGGRVQCTRCAITANTIAGLVAGNTSDLIVVDSVAVGNSTALYAQTNGSILVSNVTLTNNGKVRQTEALGYIFTHGDNRSTLYNGSPGDPYSLPPYSKD
jgi:hypothetical protein